MFILDDYRETGVNYLDFVNAVNNMVAHTDVMQIPIHAIRVCTIVYETDTAFVVAMNTGIEPKFNSKTSKLECPECKVVPFFKRKIFAKNMPPEFIQEMSAAKTIFVLNGQHTCFYREGVYNTFKQRIGLNSKDMKEKKGFILNEHIQSFLNPKRNEKGEELSPEIVTVVIRKQNDVKKLMAVNSNSYRYVPQTILCDIANHFVAANYVGLGEAVCKEWEVNHEASSLQLLFPEKAEHLQQTYGLPDKIIPGIELITSDVGECSITCKGFFMIKGSRIIQREYKKEHKGDVDPDNIITNIDNKIFSEYTKLPSRLCELLTIDVADVPFALDTAFNELKIRKFGEKTDTKLKNALLTELPSGRNYTAYDLAMSILSLQGRVADVPAYAARELEEKCIKAPFLHWEQFAPLKDGDLVVTA